MKVLVDTSVWSLALRRRVQALPESQTLSRLVEEGRVAMIGPVRQELLSGISLSSQFESLRDDLASFEDTPLSRAHFEKAAEFSNKCRKQGVQGAHTDFLICAVANLEKMAIYTADKDFEHFAKHLPVTLYHPKK